MLGLFKKTFTLLEENTLPRLYTTMLRRHLKYGDVNWTPSNRTDPTASNKITAQSLISLI
ncbi:hypothetical protein LSH36_994g00016 [Paralvinella palmiformis]|uniref:Uncharacterized protein n=1 Tax=Paralvinella palmiformis TaxID=53620 RepID=A0AAD9IWE5_9ANNE|nr:hypothetical protein LSH36_994g00016 [Paralvinella palmiformis]